MKFEIPSVLHDPPAEAHWKAHYKGFRAALAFKVAQKIYIRNRLAEAQNWRCCWCARLTVPEPNRRDSATIEHVVPRSDGGTDHPDNLAMSCLSCNNNRGTKPADLYLVQLVQGNSREIACSQRQNQRHAERRRRQAAVREALRQGLPNQYPVSSPEHKMFERYRQSSRLHLAQQAA
jgi:hypothetical protein